MGVCFHACRHANGCRLQFGHNVYRIDLVVGQQVGTLVAGEVKRQKNRVKPDVGAHLGASAHRAPVGADLNPGLVDDAELLQPAMIVPPCSHFFLFSGFQLSIHRPGRCTSTAATVLGAVVPGAVVLGNV